jgi:RNA-splicing ligase RtcB
VSALIHIGGRFLWPFILKALIKEIVDEAMLEKVNRREFIGQGLFAVSTERPAGRKLFESYGATLNFAFANRVMIQLLAQQGLSQALHRQVECTLISDNSHIGLDETVIDGNVGWLHRTAQHRIYPPGDSSLAGIFKKMGFPVVILGAPGVSSLVVTAGRDPASTRNLCSHGVAMGVSAQQEQVHNPFRSSQQDLLPFHNTAYRVDEALAAQNLQHTLETFTQLNAVQQAAILRPVMNFRAAPKSEFNYAWFSKEF